MKAKRSLAVSLTVALALVVAVIVSCAVFTACGATTHAINWNVDSHAHVTAVAIDGEAAEGMPESIEDGKSLTFQVTADNGYTVKVTGATKRTSNGVTTYSVNNITEDKEITITTSRVTQSLTVEGFDETRQYIAGDQLSLQGVVVKAHYVDEPTEVEVDNYTVAPTQFVGGETTVTFSYDGQTVEKTIPAVRYKFTFNYGEGATLDAEKVAYYQDLADRSVIGDFKNASGVLSFSYLNVSETVTLPTADDLTWKNHEILGISGSTVKEITSTTKLSVTMTVNWGIVPVVVSEIKFEKKGDDPYLMINGTWSDAVTAARLVLYEGNLPVTILEGTSVERGSSDAFNLEFNLNLLSAEEGCEGKWMDVRLYSTVEGDEGYMMIHLNTDEQKAVVDMGSKIKDGRGHAFMFTQYDDNSNNDYTLKVFYNNVDYDYTVSLEKGEQDKITATVKGTVYDQDYWGGTFEVDWFPAHNDKATISAEDGSFTVPIDITEFSAKTNYWAHIKMKSLDESKQIGYTGDVNLVLSACDTDLPVLETKAGEMVRALRVENSNGIAYYVGQGNAPGLMAYVQGEATSMTSAKLISDETDAYLAIEGTYSTNVWSTTQTAQEALAHNLKYGVQIHTDWGYTAGSDGAAGLIDATVEVTEAGKFTIKFKIHDENAAKEPADGQRLYFHYCFGAGGDGDAQAEHNLVANLVAPEIGSSVTVGGLTYTLVNPAAVGFTGWENDNGGLVMVLVSTAA